MKIGNPLPGSFRVVDGIRFTFDGKFWSGEPLAGSFMPNTGRGEDPEYHYRSGITVYRTFDRAAQAAIKRRQNEVKKARELIAKYDAATGTAQRKLVLRRGSYGYWQANGIDTVFAVEQRAGDVARTLAMANPGVQIGIPADDIGTATITAFGDIVWLKLGFENDNR